MNRFFFAVVFLGVSSIPLCVQAMDRGEYYASVGSVQHGLAPEFRRLLSSCGAKASMIVNLQAAAESHGSLEDSLVRSFLGKSHFGQNVLYCLDARIERLESTDD
jgi:hypothetical protein